MGQYFEYWTVYKSYLVSRSDALFLCFRMGLLGYPQGSCRCLFAKLKDEHRDH